MITKKQKTVLAHLTGRIPIEMRDDLKDGVPIPSDAEIKNLICVLPNDYLHKIHVGPTGERFKQLCNEAMTRIGAKERKNRPATMYRVAT